jgi:6-pyruvoyltetrahydropterin/6-carboxytetrahydropterin synthase
MWIGKQFKIDAAHYLPGHETCGEVHGHTYTITVQVEGPSIDGFVMDLHTLTTIVRKVIDPLDHKLLNNYISFPSCEKMAEHIAYELSFALPPPIRQVKVNVQEGTGGWAKYLLDVTG